MTAPQRWEPDDQMVAAVLSMPKASRKMTELSDPDRAWLVAGLTLAGMTAEDIAERTSCSRRLVMSIRAEDMTQVCKVAQKQTGEIGDELRAERCQHAVTRRELSDARAETERLRAQLDQLVDAHMAGTLTLFRCGHPRVRYNIYEHGGKSYCRQCRTDRQAVRRANRSLTCAAVNN
ncbi:hypothetical protein ACRCUN_06220 [Mycobacterium sp. LTG2003]